ncbi:MAG: Acetyl-coenzyme A carboxylase carboxyl transferase subunit alpha [Dehalococcoidia bacterium]|nr:Acetyl-coenzyme A carboxylase carboxyl transferase subunit alpha [Chloroflexota bacterium]
MREVISYVAYLTEREKQRRSRGRIYPTRLKPPKEVPEEEAQCFSCGSDLSRSELYQHYRVCQVCRFHHSLSAWERIYLLVDPGSFQGLDQAAGAAEPARLLGNVAYQQRIREAQERTGLSEAVVTGICTIGGNPAVLAVLDFGFLGGNMGMVVGDRIAKAFEIAMRRKLPVVTVVSSGGARIEEGVISLMQMARTVMAAKKLQARRLPHISVLTHPTTGEVYASFANLGNLIIAEPKAMIGFAPLSVIRSRVQSPESRVQSHGEGDSRLQTPDSRPAEMDHTAESHLEHGLVDQIVDRTRLRHLVSITLDLLSSRYRLGMRKKVRPYLAPTHPQEQAWQAVQLARHAERPTSMDYITRITSTFIEIHGDRSHSDDPAIVCGLAELGGEAVVIIGQQRDRNEGHTAPEGFRKAQRAMRLAARFNLPLINLIDTPGAYPGAESEERGIGNAIASTMALLADIPTPVISAIIGQGGSEGALALGIADRVLIMENAFLSVISPERAASIFFRDVEKAAELASALRLTAADCKRLGVADVVVPEPEGGAHTDPEEAARMLRNLILRELLQVQTQSPTRLVKSRYKRFRYLGGRTSLLMAVFSRQAAQIQKLLRP